MNHEFSTIASLIQYAQTGTGSVGKGVYFLGEVTPLLATDITQASGLQVVGYRVAIDHSAIIHTLRKHGQPADTTRADTGFPG